MSPPPDQAQPSTPNAAVSPFKGVRGWRRLRNALNYSLAGLRASYDHEAAFRQESWLAAVLLVVACWLPLNGVERALLMGSVLLVPIVELLNTGIEAVVDRIGQEVHQLSKRAKDAGSAAVLLALINTLVVWVSVLAPKL